MEMRPVAVLLLTSHLLVAGSCSDFNPSDNDPRIESLAKTVENFNKYLEEKKWEYLSIPPQSINLITASVKTENGNVGKFSTLTLKKGIRQHVKKTVVQGATIYNFDLQLGLGLFKFHYEYEYSVFFFKRSGVLEIASKNEPTLEVKGVVNVQNDGTCYSVLETAQISQESQYEVKILPEDLPRTVLTSLMEFVANKISPLFRPVTNFAIDKAVKHADFSQVLCDSFIKY